MVEWDCGPRVRDGCFGVRSVSFHRFWLAVTAHRHREVDLLASVAYVCSTMTCNLVFLPSRHKPICFEILILNLALTVEPLWYLKQDLDDR
jgi:hypothetical protein